MTINANTKISALLKYRPESLEAIVSISPKFEKLRNPLLRKVIAGRTSITMASKLGGCRVEDFFTKLQPLGFEIDKTTVAIDEHNENELVPDFLKNIHPNYIAELDVRPVIESGKDPLSIILKEVEMLEPGHALKIINGFEPTPLMELLRKQGFDSYAETINDELVHTYFFKKTDKPFVTTSRETDNYEGWDEAIQRFGDKLEMIDVRDLPMPLPMHSILEALKNLPEDRALFVYHKRIPVFLLPELEDQKFSYRIKEINDGEVRLLIYKD